MPIRVLSPAVAAKIAAGEVIERPASVAKELLENAIDAGADDIRIDIAQGGRRLIRVSDNGSGIPSAEVELAFARHATSKLQSADQLYHLQTLGFRGEALASIAAVSRLTLATRTADEAAGTVVRLESGEVVHREPQARARGTTVQVENLFFNTPARLKFLRTDATEAGHISRLVTSYALAFPDKRFALQHNERQLLRTSGSGALLEVIAALYGVDLVEQMIPVAAPANELGIAVQGYVGGPALHRGSRRELLFFVNRRWIEDNALAFAVREAYRTLIPQGRYPLAVILVELPPEDVDVNIHPTKREVRFRHERQMFSSVQRAVRAALMAQHPVQSFSADASTVHTWGERPRQWGAPESGPAQSGLGLATTSPQSAAPVSAGGPFVTPQSAAQPAARLPMLRVVGQIAQSYIVAEGPGGLYLIDQHAAHERIRYEQLLAHEQAATVTSQELLQPQTIELSPQHATLLVGHLSALARHGLEIAPFGGTTFLVRRIPSTLAAGDLNVALIELLNGASEGGASLDWDEATRITLACHTAIRAGQTLSHAEMQELVRQLEQCALPHACPHGRPTMVLLSRAQLEREFGRI
jgi:DNA mismatch repair protein MutL